MKKIRVNEEFVLDDGMQRKLIARINAFGQLHLMTEEEYKRPKEGNMV